MAQVWASVFVCNKRLWHSHRNDLIIDQAFTLIFQNSLPKLAPSHANGGCCGFIESVSPPRLDKRKTYFSIVNWQNYSIGYLPMQHLQFHFMKIHFNVNLIQLILTTKYDHPALY